MTDASYFWTNLVLLAAGTLVIRGALIAVLGNVRLTEYAREVFSYIPAAIFPAIIAPAALLYKGEVEWLAGKERIPATLAAIAICYYTRSTILTIVVTLFILFALRTWT